MTSFPASEPNYLRGFSNYVADRLWDGIGEDCLLPLEEEGQFAYIQLETAKVYLITIQEARLTPTIRITTGAS